MFFLKDSSELFLDLSEEQQETVAGGKVYENSKQYYMKTETSDGGNTDSAPQTRTGDRPFVIDFINRYAPFQIGEQVMFPTIV
jgi:hypothetical protein